MAEGDGFVFNIFKEQCLTKEHDLSADAAKVALHGTGWARTIDGDIAWADVTDEMTGSGYATGGDTPGTPTVTRQDATDRAEYNLVDASWTALNLTGGTGFPTPNSAVLYNSATTTPDNALIAYWELGTTATNGSDYTLQWGATVMNLT